MLYICFLSNVSFSIDDKIQPNAIVVGNPAKIIGYVDTQETTLGSENHGKSLPEEVSTTSVNGVTLHSLKEVTDIRGRLSVGRGGERSVPYSLCFFHELAVCVQNSSGHSLSVAFPTDLPGTISGRCCDLVGLVEVLGLNQVSQAGLPLRR